MENNLENWDQAADSFVKLGRPVQTDSAGGRIDSFLAQNYLFCSRNQWIQRIRSQLVLVNQRPVRASYRLRPFDEIFLHAPADEEPPVNRDLRVLWQDGGVMAVFKPANLPMHEGGVYHRNTFVKILAETQGPEWAPIHRLDRETSGIVVCAATSHLRAVLSRDFFLKNMEKTYVAIAKGSSSQSEWFVDQPLGSTSTRFQRVKQTVLVGGQPSQTRFTVCDQAEKACLLKVYPKTGRTHQIRVHAAWSGLPLVGDKKYQTKDDIYSIYLDRGFNDYVREWCWYDRLCLHAEEIGFRHPERKTWQQITAPMPIDMQNIWSEVSKA